MRSYVSGLLLVLLKAGEPVGWYYIERRLSGLALSEHPDLLEVLGRLRREGLVEFSEHATTPTERYSLTPEGKEKARIIAAQDP